MLDKPTIAKFADTLRGLATEIHEISRLVLFPPEPKVTIKRCHPQSELAPFSQLIDLKNGGFFIDMKRPFRLG